MNDGFILVVAIILGCVASSAFAQVKAIQARDVSVKSEVPTPKDTIPRRRLEELVAHGAGGEFGKTRVITPPMRIVVRQNHPAAAGGPTYQEALSYDFLIHSMKFPFMTRMDNGRIMLVATAWEREGEGEPRYVFSIHSDDEAKSWSQPNVIQRDHSRPQPVSLGGQKLMLIQAGEESSKFSDDGGKTWPEVQSMPRMPDGKQTWHHGSVLAEGNTIYSISYYEGAGHGPTGLHTAYSVLWVSHDLGRTWDTAIRLPAEWRTSEGSVTRARDGALVVALRTSQKPGLPSYSDHWRRLTTARSTDDGLTWTDHQVHFDYGRVHAKLTVLANGDLLMTYASRMGDVDGQMYHGIEAVLSRDHGKTWDWDNRFILFRWAMSQHMHSPYSLELSDGRILTVFTYHYYATWDGGSVGRPGYPLGLTSAVIWSPSAGAGE